MDQTAQPIVYQVRAINRFNQVRIVHAYETEALAQQAISTMKSRTGFRYVYVPVPNNPDEHWGINFPPKPKPATKQ